MAKFEISSLDEVDEHYHADYVKADNGKYRLKVEGLELAGVADVTNLKKSIESEREITKQQKAELAEIKRLRDEADMKAMEEQGKHKELGEKFKQDAMQAQLKFEELQRKTNEKTRDLMVRELASSMTTDPTEIEVIVRFGADYVTIEGDEVKFNKSTDEIKAEMSRFIRSKASGSGDKGNTNGGGAVKASEYFDKNSPNFSLTEQGRIFNENPTLYKQLKQG